MAEHDHHRTRRHHRRALALISAGCAALLIALTLLPPYLPRVPLLGLLRDLDRRVTDQLQVYGRKAALPAEVVFLGITSNSYGLDDLSLAERQGPALELMAQTPVGSAFPRRLYPLVLDRLFAAGAKVVVFDMIFASAKDEENDAPFRAALERYRDSVVIGSNVMREYAANGDPVPKVDAPSRSLLPVEEPIYDERAGFVNYLPESDGLVRSITYRTTVLEALQEQPEESAPEIFSLSAQAVRKSSPALLPRGHEPRLFRFLGDVPSYPLHQIFVPALWEKTMAAGELFRGKIVFIGPSDNTTKDQMLTPLGNTLGPVVHLSALSALLRHDFLHRPYLEADLLLILAGSALAVAAGLLIPDPLLRTAALLAVAAGYLGVAFTFYNTQGWLLNLVSPLTALLSSGGIGLVWERLLEQKAKNRMRKTLEGYVSKDVVAEVLDNPDSFLLQEGGQRRPITILFSDVRGFTTLTESADPRQLVMQLNEYFTEMVRIVFAHDGTLDKFIGDAVMAHWGSVVSRGAGPDACHAVAAALDMLEALQRLNAGWKARGMLELQIGLGINHGEAICGHIGSSEKHEMTAIGDAVNLASRLEGATKEFHQDLLLGEGVAPLVRECYHLRTVDLLQVKGKTRPVEVFSVGGLAGEGTQLPAWLAAHEEGVRQYRARSFAQAERSFARALEQRPGDWLAEEYHRRAQAYQEEAPLPEWDGVFVMTKK